MMDYLETRSNKYILVYNATNGKANIFIQNGGPESRLLLWLCESAKLNLYGDLSPTDHCFDWAIWMWKVNVFAVP